MPTFYIDSPSEGILELTSTQSISIKFPSSVTSHPLQEGGSVVDNIVNSNITISFDGIISDVRRLYSGFNEETGDNQKNTQDYVDALTRIRQRKELFTVFYDPRFNGAQNCVMTNVTLDKTMEVSNGYKVNIAFEQIRVSRRAEITFTRDDFAQDRTDSDSANTEGLTIEGREVEATLLPSLARVFKDSLLLDEGDLGG